MISFELENPIFKEEAMRKFIAKDSFLRIVFRDLSNKNQDSSEREILEIVFNSNVIDDSGMISEYNRYLK